MKFPIPFKEQTVSKISCLCLKSFVQTYSSSQNQTISMTDSLSEKILSCRNTLQKENDKKTK